MKKILVTQRVDYVASHGEYRDALDQRWIPLLLQAGLMPVPVSNNLSMIEHMLSQDKFDGVLFTGGNTLVAYGGDCKIRDEVEQHLIEWAINVQVPVLGVCRGMQLIQHIYSTPLEPVANHVGVEKQLHVLASDPVSRCFAELSAVSVFHQMAAYTCSAPLKVLAKTKSEVVMAVGHESLPIYGVMWHPEREVSKRSKHVEYLKIIFKGAE